jgi:prepilin peptidase CpaA
LVVTTAQPLLAAMLLLTAVLLVGAGFSDARRLWIPDRYWIGIAAAYGIAALTQPLSVAAGGIATAAIIFFAGATLFARGWIGGGDVKLLSSLALWAGPSGLAAWLFNTALAGAGLALVMLLRLRLRSPAHWRVHEPLGQPMPFAVAIAVGGMALVLSLWPQS